MKTENKLLFRMGRFTLLDYCFQMLLCKDIEDDILIMHLCFILTELYSFIKILYRKGICHNNIKLTNIGFEFNLKYDAYYPRIYDFSLCQMEYYQS